MLKSVEAIHCTLILTTQIASIMFSSELRVLSTSLSGTQVRIIQSLSLLFELVLKCLKFHISNLNNQLSI